MPRTKQQYEEIRNKTRMLILETALELFANKGFAGTSMEDIAKAAGVSKGLAYNYFESKQHLAEAIFKNIIDVGIELEKAFDAIEDPFKKLNALINDTFDFLQRDQKLWKLYTTFAMQTDMQQIAVSATNEFAQRFIKKLNVIFKKIGVKNPVMESLFLGALFDGISLDYFFMNEEYPLQKMRKFLLKKYSREELLKNK